MDPMTAFCPNESRIRQVRGSIADQVNRLRGHF
jgi:hypothetical protein